jgi:hypothetical protein
MAASASWAWPALIGGVIVYNIAARDGEMLSEQADRAIRKHPVAVRAAAVLVAAHVANLLPQRVDAIHWFFETLKLPKYFVAKAVLKTVDLGAVP